MTDDEKHIDFVKTNLLTCRESLDKAEIANKGRLVHRILYAIRKLKPLLEILELRDPMDVSKEEILLVCKWRITMNDALWQVSQDLGGKPWLTN